MYCDIDSSRIPSAPDGAEWVDDDFFGWVHKTTHWHTTAGVRLRKLRGGLTFVQVPGPGEPLRPSPPAVADDDLEPDC